MERFLRLKEDCIPDFRAYLAQWVRGADPRSLRRENVREFVRYGFYGGVDGPLSDEEEAEIEWWLREVERVWAIELPEGRAEGLRFMRHMREPLRTFHQPLLLVARRQVQQGAELRVETLTLGELGAGSVVVPIFGETLGVAKQLLGDCTIL